MINLNKEDLIRSVSEKIKLVRVEAGYSQEEMAAVLGISKKTLVQIEKERVEANWTLVVAVISLFQNSDIVRNLLGNEPLEIVELIAHKELYTPKEKTLGGKVWWTNLKEDKGYILQQNILSRHFRILDCNGYRWYSTLEEEDVLEFFNKITGGI